MRVGASPVSATSLDTRTSQPHTMDTLHQIHSGHILCIVGWLAASQWVAHQLPILTNPNHLTPGGEGEKIIPD